MIDTLTQKRRRRYGSCGRGVCGFCPSDVLSSYFSEYTNDEPLKTNFMFIDPTEVRFQRLISWKNHKDLYFFFLNFHLLHNA